MSARIELKPCPFCGGEAKLFSLGSEYEVYCTECHSSSGWYSQKGEAAIRAAAAWNRRADNG